MMRPKIKFEPKHLLAGWRQMTKAEKIGLVVGALLLASYFLAWLVHDLFLKPY